MEPRAGEMAQHATLPTGILKPSPSGSEGPDTFSRMCTQPHTNEWLRKRMNQELSRAALLSEVLNIIQKSREGLRSQGFAVMEGGTQ